MKTPHSSCHRGKRVLVVLADGNKFIDRFIERTGKFIVMDGHKLRVKQIRSFSIAKPKESNG